MNYFFLYSLQQKKEIAKAEAKKTAVTEAAAEDNKQEKTDGSS